MKRVIIANLIDWSKSFVDPDGTFYCGTTVEEKRNAARIVSLADLVINTTDLHPLTAPEHAINGGLYPVHNVVLPQTIASDFVYARAPDGTPVHLGNKTPSPCLTDALQSAVEGRSAGIIVPRGVYFQGNSGKPFCSPDDIRATFGEEIVSDQDFIRGAIDYVIAPKQFFDATRIDSDASLPDTKIPKVPGKNYNVYSLLKQRFPEDQYELVFVNTGVVEGICRLHTSIGLKQMFPRDRVINIADASTPLYGIGLGYASPQESRDACMRVCKDIGIEYMTTDECVKQLAEGE